MSAMPCPFCGHKPTVDPLPAGNDGIVKISCANGKCHVNPQAMSKTEQGAIIKWNVRAGA